MRGLIGLRRALLLTAAVLTACSSQAHTVTSPTAAGRGVTLAGSIETTGDFKISGSFSVRPEMQVGPLPTPAPISATCSQYAKGLGKGNAFVSPEIHTSGNPNVYARAVVSAGYAGPGTYTTQNAPGLTGVAIVSIQQGQGPASQLYNTRHGGSTALTVAADGSGTLAFTRWGSDEVRQGHIAGYLWANIHWTCR